MHRCEPKDLLALVYEGKMRCDKCKQRAVPIFSRNGWGGEVYTCPNPSCGAVIDEEEQEEKED